MTMPDITRCTLGVVSLSTIYIARDGKIYICISVQYIKIRSGRAPWTVGFPAVDSRSPFASSQFLSSHSHFRDVLMVLGQQAFRIIHKTTRGRAKVSLDACRQKKPLQS